MTEVLTGRANDPIYQDERIMYGVDDKESYILEASKDGNHKESRRSHCVVCTKGSKAKAIFGMCETHPDIECNCCESHRTNCVLK